MVICAVDGMAGVGKTTLAVHAGHRLAERFPDGQVFLDLHGHTPGHRPLDPSAALDALLRAAGVADDRVPAGLHARAALWRTASAGRRVLIVLDNAVDAAQVRPLLPGTPGCRVLITSRRRLSDLDATHTVSLDVLPSDDAVALLAGVLGPERAAAEPGAVAELVELCGRLPLAVRITGGRLRSRPGWAVAHLVRRMRAGYRLAELTTGDRSVDAALTSSYERLGPSQRRFFRLLGRLPGPDLDAPIASALASIGPGEAERLLEDLVDVHLLQQPLPGRYRFHELVHEYVRMAAAEPVPGGV